MLPRGLEPRTLGLLDLRSDQLSYESSENQIPQVHHQGVGAAREI